MATIDLTQRSWGHDYVFETSDSGKTGRMTIWCSKIIREGDYLLLRNGEGSTRYQVMTVRRMSDPPDQLFATVKFSPRKFLVEEKR